jgi:hypothetical protein
VLGSFDHHEGTDDLNRCYSGALNGLGHNRGTGEPMEVAALQNPWRSYSGPSAVVATQRAQLNHSDVAAVPPVTLAARGHRWIKATVQ